MKANQRIRVMLGFLAGVAVTVAVTFGFLYGQDARAANPCTRTALEAYNNAGDIPGPVVRVAYQIPSCFKSSGYAVDSVVRLQSGGISVTYKKK
jgi:hypothetical protein